jgi:hypothetical protein
MKTESESEGSGSRAGGCCGRFGEKLIKAIGEVVHEGNVRHVVIKHGDGRTFAEFPVSIGLAGAVLFPAWTGIGVIAALVTDRTIEVVRTTDENA